MPPRRMPLKCAYFDRGVLQKAHLRSRMTRVHGALLKMGKWNRTTTYPADTPSVISQEASEFHRSSDHSAHVPNREATAVCYAVFQF